MHFSNASMAQWKDYKDFFSLKIASIISCLDRFKNLWAHEMEAATITTATAQATEEKHIFYLENVDDLFRRQIMLAKQEDIFSGQSFLKTIIGTLYLERQFCALCKLNMHRLCMLQ